MKQQRLTFAGRLLQDRFTLSDYDVQRESIFHMEPLSPDYIDIFIETSTGETLSFMVQTNETVEGVKSLIHSSKGIHPCQQVLSFDWGHLQSDQCTLADYGISHQSILYLQSLAEKDVINKVRSPRQRWNQEVIHDAILIL